MWVLCVLNENTTRSSFTTTAYETGSYSQCNLLMFNCYTGQCNKGFRLLGITLYGRHKESNWRSLG